MVDSKEKRERGLYWVKEDGVWTIARYGGIHEDNDTGAELHIWYIIGDSQWTSEESFDEIDERKIERA